MNTWTPLQQQPQAPQHPATAVVARGAAPAWQAEREHTNRVSSTSRWAFM